MLFIVITIALITSAWLCYDLYRKPIISKKDDIDDPTTTCWHDDDYHPDSNL